MKAANFLNIVLALALLLLCAKLHVVNLPSAAGDVDGKPAADEAAAPSVQIIDSTDLAPGATGFGGPVPVEVEIREGVVARVSPKLPNDETPAFFERLEAAGFWQSWDGLPVAEAATARVDAVTSATYSSKAAIAHVRAALASAAGLPAPDPEPAPAAEPPRVPFPGEPPAPAPAPAPAAGSPSASPSDYALAALGADASVLSIVPPPAPVFRPIDVKTDFAENPFTWFTGRGLLLCAGDRTSHNAMTIGWGGLGTLWGRNDAVTVYVAENRHTKTYMDRAARFTVMAFDKERQASILDYMGRHSGRDGDKAAALGLHTAYTDAGTPYYEEAQLVLECELMYSAPFDPAGMKDVPRALYADFPAGLHTMYIGRIVAALQRQP